MKDLADKMIDALENITGDPEHLIVIAEGIKKLNKMQNEQDQLEKSNKKNVRKSLR